MISSIPSTFFGLLVALFESDVSKASEKIERKIKLHSSTSNKTFNLKKIEVDEGVYFRQELILSVKLTRPLFNLEEREIKKLFFLSLLVS